MKSHFFVSCTDAVKKLTSVLLIISFILFAPLSAFAQQSETNIDNSQTQINNESSSSVEQNPPTLEDIKPLIDFPESNINDDQNTSDSSSEKNSNTDTTSVDNSTEQTDLVDQSKIDKSSSVNSLLSLGPTDPRDIPTLEKQLPVQPDYSSGALTYSFPIKVPPGRNNLQPNLELRYNNQSADDSAIFGYNWSINIPYIQRINKTGTEKMFSSNFFYSSLSGELATTSISTNFISKTENGDFYKYTFSSSTWVVYDKNGTKYTFGTTTSERQDDPSDSTRIYKWMLTEIRDTNNNYIKYQYYKDGGQIYPSAIIYTGNGSTDGIFEVDFIRTSRSDNKILSAKTGFQVANNYQISEIQVKVNGTWVRKYALAYSAGVNFYRSMLGSITESGQDDLSNTITLPAYNFTYSSTTKGWTDTGWSMPTYFDYNTQGFYIGDVNGDGLPDVLDKRQNGIISEHSWINKGDGTWNDATTTWNPVWLDYNGVGMGEFNGDGLPDIYYSYQGGMTNVNQIYINNGAGWTLSSSTMPLNMDQNFTGTYVIDINGDGLSDVIRNTDYGSGATYHYAFINNGDGTWTDMGTTTWAIPEYMNYPGSGIADLNGDGLPDVYRSAQNGTVVHDIFLNNGHGFTNMTGPGWGLPIYIDTPSTPGKTIPFYDVNGDGLTDIIYNNDYGSGGTFHYVFINNGDGTWNGETDWGVPVYMNQVGKGAGDFNGDGMVDIYDSNPYGPANKIYLNNGKRTDLLINVKNSSGGTLGFSYKATPQYKDGSNNLLNPSLPYVIQTVNTISINDGLGTIGTTTYSYQSGSNYYVSPIDHQIAGFNSVTKTDAVGNVIKTYFHQGNSSDSSHGEYQDNYSKIGKIYRTEKYDNSSNLFSKIINKWDNFSLGFGANFVKLTQSVQSNYDGNGTHKDKANSYTYDNTYGNLQQNINYGEVNGNDDGTFSDTGSDLASTTISYASNVGLYIVGLPSSEISQNSSLIKISETQHYYDNQSLGSVNVGNETKIANWISGSTYASTTKTYDGTYGLVTQSKDPKSNVTNYIIDSKNLYPATTTNALSQATGNVYDYASGKVKYTFDPNSRVYTTTFDALRRPLTISVPDPSTDSLVTKTTYSYNDSNTPGSTYVLQTNYLNSATSSTAYTYVDGFGRNLQQRTLAQGNNTYTVKDWTYNNLGLLNSESFPYFASSTSRSAATGVSALYTTYSYDPLLRISKITNAVGSTTNQYDDWTVHVTDPNGKIKDYLKDSRDNLISVVEHISGAYATTSYTYDLNNNLATTTDALGNVRGFTYDGLNRRLSAQDMHVATDTTYGFWKYTYDLANNLTQVIDAKSQTINYGYDALNRVITEDYTGQAGTEVLYGYDTCTNGKTRLCNATTTDAVTNLTYNPNGNIASEKETINSTNYLTSYTYDRQGNLANVTYPDNSIVSYGYDNTGYLYTVSRKAANSSQYVNAISELGYGPTGAVTLKRFGNGVVSTYTYDANQLYRLTNILSVASSTVSQSGGVGGALGLLVTPHKYQLASKQNPLAFARFDLAEAQTNVAQSLNTDSSNSVTSALSGVQASSTEQSLKPDLLGSTATLHVDGKIKDLNSTDDNDGEDLIINTDSYSYNGISQATVYFSVENTTTNPQNVDFSFYFKDNKENVGDIERLSPIATIVQTYTLTCTQGTIATTSKNKKNNNDCVITPGESRQEFIANEKTKSLNTSATDKDKAAANLAMGLKDRKSVNGYVSDKSSQDMLQPGEKGYYKAVIHFPQGSSGKFYIEAIGNNGGYGHLDPWYSSNWLYRKKVTIAGQSGSGTNYQVLLKVGESSGSTGAQFNLGGLSALFPSGNDNGGDLRFTASDGSTELNYWVEDVTGSAPNRTAYVWVKVADDLGTNKDIYVYYGYINASNASNGSATFNLFDDFNDGVINGTKWTTICSSGCNITDGSSSSISETGGVIKQFDAPVGGSQSRVVATSTSIGTTGSAMKRRFRRTDDGTFSSTNVGFGTNVSIVGDVGTSTVVHSANFENKIFILSTATSTYEIYGTDISINTWYREESRRVNANTTGGTIWSDTNVILGNGTTTLSSNVNDTEYPQLRSGDGDDSETDWTFVRNYHSPEPTYSTSTSKEIVGTAGSYLYRKKITIAGQSGSGTNYQVLLKIGETGGAAGANLDLVGHSLAFPTGKNDGGDLKFTKSDGTTSINFWVEDVTGSAPNRLAYIWVKVPDDLGTNKDIYVYYGNTAPINMSSGTSTFNLFDDFDGSAVDFSKWTTICSTGCKVTAGVSSSVSVSGGTVKQLDAAVANSQGRIVATTTQVNTSGYALYRRFRRTDTGTFGNGDLAFGTNVTSHSDNGTTTPDLGSANFGQNTTINSTATSSVVIYSTVLGLNTWYREESRRVSANTVAGTIWSDAHSSLGNRDNITLTSNINDTEYPILRSGDGHDTETDWVALRKYHNLEPAFSSSAGEEFVGNGTSTPYAQIIQNISYTYDASGNITQITDRSDIGTAKVVNFVYDDLNRLTSASTTAATTTPYIQTYTYNYIGNITNKSDVGSYVYAGNTGSLYSNPHAPTTVGATSYTYDRNGNITGVGATVYSWTYRNLLATSTTGSATTTYGYDYNKARVKMTVGSTATIYPNKYWNVVGGATTTANIYVGDILIASVEGTGKATTTQYLHQDHLNSTNVVTNANSNVAQTLDYYPYGSSRISTSYANINDKHKFIGQYFDDSTNLSYLNARYYNPQVGQFISQDPVFWEIGLTEEGKKVLTNPQDLNSYSYGRNNPINLKDPNGRSVLTGAQGFSEGIAVSAIATALILSAPVTIPAAVVTGIALVSTGSIGYSTYSNYKAYTSGQITKDQFDYNAGNLLGSSIPLVGLSRLTETNTVNVRYTQNTISPKFSDAGTFAGKTLDEVIVGLKSGSIKPTELPINYTDIDGVRLVDNNRSAYVLKQAGIPENKWNWNSNGVEVVNRVMQKLQYNSLSPGGTNVIKITSGNSK